MDKSVGAGIEEGAGIERQTQKLAIERRQIFFLFLCLFFRCGLQVLLCASTSAKYRFRHDSSIGQILANVDRPMILEYQNRYYHRLE